MAGLFPGGLTGCSHSENPWTRYRRRGLQRRWLCHEIKVFYSVRLIEYEVPLPGHGIRGSLNPIQRDTSHDVRAPVYQWWMVGWDDSSA